MTNISQKTQKHDGMNYFHECLSLYSLIAFFFIKNYIISYFDQYGPIWTVKR